MPNSFVVKISLHDVHKLSHLRENEEAVIESFKFREDTVNEFEFA